MSIFRTLLLYRAASETAFIRIFPNELLFESNKELTKTFEVESIDDWSIIIN